MHSQADSYEVVVVENVKIIPEESLNPFQYQQSTTEQTAIAQGLL
jgi:hypothetical protein